MILFIGPEAQANLPDRTVQTLRASARARANAFIKALLTCSDAGITDIYCDTAFFDGDSRHLAAARLEGIECESASEIAAWLRLDREDGVYFYDGVSMPYKEGEQ